MESVERELHGLCIAEPLSQSCLPSAAGWGMHRIELQLRGRKFGSPPMRRRNHNDVDHHPFNDNKANDHDDSVYFNVVEHHNYHLNAADNEPADDYYGYYADVDDNYDRKSHHYRYYVDEYADKHSQYDGIIHAESDHNDCGADNVVHKVDRRAAVQSQMTGTDASSTTTTASVTTTSVGDKCPQRPSLIAIDESSNSTALTDSLNIAYNAWTRNSKANFNMYKKRVETIIYGNEYSAVEAKVALIADVLHGYAPEGSTYRDEVMTIIIVGWGTVEEFVACE
ncbi:hypothetical protein AAVH_20672 [Aphelenchoides avenae]|nr:hypothetical protein AAVH_20672 [Aphelenchus avenae]